jgi:hypothetical protein
MNIPAVTKEMYDVDIVDTYKNIKELLQKVNYFDGFKPADEFLNSVLLPIKQYCTKNQLPLDYVLSNNYPIIIDSTKNSYQWQLGLALMAYDVNKIEAFLDYQRKEWKRPGSFLSFVDSVIYRFVKKNSPFDNQGRLDKIPKWVNKRRGEEKGPYLYWNGKHEDLEALYNELVRYKLIDVNPNFFESFKKLDIKGEFCTTWRGSNRQLMWLMYLIYDKKDRYNNLMLHNIAVSLFKKSPKVFSANTLSVTLRQIINEEKEGAMKSAELISVENIVAKR